MMDKEKLEFMIKTIEDKVREQGEIKDELETLHGLYLIAKEANEDERAKNILLIAMSYQEKVLANQKEINRYNLEELKAYLEKRMEYNKVVSDLKLIEKLSKKTTDFCVTTYSAEGRKRQIDKDLVNEYNELVLKKRRLGIDILNIENKVNSFNPNIMNKIEVEVEEENLNPEVKKDYEDLTLDEKINYLDNEINNIINVSKEPNMGKKRLINYQNEKHEIALCLYGKYKENYLKLAKLKKEKELEESKRKEEALKEKEIDDIIKEVNTYPSDNNNYSADDILKEVNNDEYSVDNIIKEVKGFDNAPKEEDNKIIEIKNIRKPFNKRDIIKKVKAAVAVIVATTVLFSLGSCLRIKNNNKTIDEVIKEEEVIENPKIEEVNDTHLQIGDIVKVNSQTPIYRSSMDVASKTNPLTPYFKDDDDRVIDALVYNEDDKITTVWGFQENYNEQINKLEQEGATLVGCVYTKKDLAGRGQYEGFKPIEDFVIVNNVVGGR